MLDKVAESQESYGDKDLHEIIIIKEKAMQSAAKELDFILAAKIRDEIKALKEKDASS